MRCLALVDALRVKACFVCAEVPGHLADHIRARGHEAVLIPANVGQLHDAALTGRSVDESTAWVIVDHYRLNATWESAMPCNVLAIDDLADRNHSCEILIDQNWGRQGSDYEGLVPPGATVLAGPHFALLRQDFSQLRSVALERREALRSEPLRRILISMGGSDASNATGWAIESLHSIPLNSEFHADVVLGPSATNRDAVAEAVSLLPCNAELHLGTTRMAQLMVSADLAIGAAGSTSWERCVLGLPSALCVLAPNQQGIADALSRAGAVDRVRLGDTPGLVDVLLRMQSGDYRSAMTQAAMHICDGQGATRVADIVRRWKT